MESYLDNAATTRVNKVVVEKINEVLLGEFGNPSSIHTKGMNADKILKNSRVKIGESINASYDEIIFTSCASEGNNQVLKNYSGSHIITTEIEHPSVRTTLKEMEKEGTEVTYLKVDEKGKINLEELKNSIRKDTALVSIMMVNNEIGVINDLEKIGQIIKESNTKAKFHSDIVQGYLKFKIDVKKLNLDFATFSMHKVHGPKGIGVLYIKKGMKIKSLINGGGQEFSYRAGTHNVPYINGISVIPEIYLGKMEDNYNKVMEYKLKMYNFFKEIKGFKLNGEIDGYSPYILNVSFNNIPAQVFLNLLSEKNVFISTGSACSQKNMKDSHVLEAIGVNKDYIKGSARVSFSDDTTMEEIDNAIEGFKFAFKFLKKI